MLITETKTERPVMASPSSAWRQRWARIRAELEGSYYKVKPDGGRIRRRFDHFKNLITLSRIGLKAFGFEWLGERNARRLQVSDISLSFERLPSAFDGYRILHLTDFHFERLPGLEEEIIRKVEDREVDLAVFSGDYQDRYPGVSVEAMKALEKLMGKICARDGVLGVLGNHDTYRLVPILEGMGVQLLINESMRIDRKGQSIHLTGLDDVHHFYSEMAREAISMPIDGFKMAVVHSPEAYAFAAENGYSFYLTGHTHGGQICLPNKVPIFTHLYIEKRFASGFWKHKNLIGYTNRGVGVTTTPSRFFCPGEILFLTLQCKN